MACTLGSPVASMITPAGRSSNLPSAKKPPCSLNVKARAGGEGPLQQPKNLQQSRRPPQDSSILLLDSWNPFSRGGLRQMMDTVDQLFLDDMAQARASGVRGGVTKVSAGVRSPWDVAEDDEAFHIRVDMPGFAKEDVKIAVEDGVLVVSGQRDASKEDARWAAKSYSKFNTRLALPDNVRPDKISAELKNGVLFVAVPKVKPEERKQVFDIQIS